MFKYLLVDHAVPAMCPSRGKCEIAEQFLHKDAQSSPGFTADQLAGIDNLQKHGVRLGIHCGRADIAPGCMV
jgi:hypothetical protein